LEDVVSKELSSLPPILQVALWFQSPPDIACMQLRGVRHYSVVKSGIVIAMLAEEALRHNPPIFMAHSPKGNLPSNRAESQLLWRTRSSN